MAKGFPRQGGTHASAAITSRSYNGTQIQRRSADGYVNATAMCKAGGRRWNHYRANERSQEYIAALETSLTSAGNPANLTKTVRSGPNDQRGTWIHPRLAVDLARWISPAFAVWMDGWFLETIQAPPAPPTPPAPELPVIKPEPPVLAPATDIGNTWMTWGHRWEIQLTRCHANEAIKVLGKMLKREATAHEGKMAMLAASKAFCDLAKLMPTH